jgi:hypothetical protein
MRRATKINETWTSIKANCDACGGKGRQAVKQKETRGGRIYPASCAMQDLVNARDHGHAVFFRAGEFQ